MELEKAIQGHILGEGGENSYCRACNTELISRFGFSIRRNSLIDGRCSKCGEQIEGVWN